MLRRLVRFGTWLAAGLAILAFPAAWLLDTLTGADYWLLEPKADAATLALEKSQWKADHADGKGGTDREVLEIYGSPFSSERVLLASKDRVKHPDERPGLVYLEVWKSKGENPLQARSVWLVAKFMLIGGGIAALGGLILLRLMGRKQRAAAPSSFVNRSD